MKPASSESEYTDEPSTSQSPDIPADSSAKESPYPPKLLQRSETTRPKSTVFRASSKNMPAANLGKSRHVPLCPKMCYPIVRTTYPSPEKPGFWYRFYSIFLCPPRFYVATFYNTVLFTVISWAALYGMIGKDAYPGNLPFFIVLLEISGLIVGQIVSLIRLPPLFGMLLTGFFLGNVLQDLRGCAKARETWYPILRSIALSIILTRAGLGLNPAALRRLSFVCFRLAFTPCLVEAITICIASYFILNLNWLWGLMLGFALAAVSPAVVVPGMLTLQRNNLCVVKGLPTLVIAAASIDDVLAIGGFGIVISIAFGSNNLILQVLHGPMEVLIGIIFGSIIGVILWFIPDPLGSHVTSLRVTLLFCAGILGLCAGRQLEITGAGALGIIILAFVAAYSWRDDYSSSGLRHISVHYTRLWRFFEPMLFGVVGADILYKDLFYNEEMQIAMAKGLATLAIGLSFRLVAANVAVMGCGFTFKERFFISLAWIPKATVQAAIGPYVLDYLYTEIPKIPAHQTEQNYFNAKLIRNLTAIAILITAPLGAALIALTAKLLLTEDEVLEEEIDDVNGSPKLYLHTESETEMIEDFLIKANASKQASRTTSKTAVVPPTQPGKEYRDFLSGLNHPQSQNLLKKV